MVQSFPVAVQSSCSLFLVHATQPGDTTPTILLDIQNKLDLGTSKTFLINLGNDRSNITPIIVKMTDVASDLAALDFVLDEPHLDQPF